MDSQKDYGIIPRKNSFMYNASANISQTDVTIHDKAFPTEPLNFIRIHALEKSLAQKTIGPIILGDEIKKNGLSENVLVIDLSDEVVGRYYLYGLLVDTAKQFKELLADIAAGKITVCAFGLDRTKLHASVGAFIEDLINLCKKSNLQVPVIHLFMNDTSIIGKINKIMKDYFIKINGELVDDEDDTNTGLK